MHPELKIYTGVGLSADEQLDLLELAIQEAWDAIPQEYFDRVGQSMQRRCEAVIAAKGWQTKY